MLWTAILPLVLFGMAAYSDWKTRKIPDWLISLCWIALLLPIYGFDYSLQVGGMAVGFGIMYFGWAFSLKSSKDMPFASGDILLCGPLAGFLVGAGVFWLFVPTMLLCLVLGYVMKDGCPDAVIFFLGILAAILV